MLNITVYIFWGLWVFDALATERFAGLSQFARSESTPVPRLMGKWKCSEWRLNRGIEALGGLERMRRIECQYQST